MKDQYVGDINDYGKYIILDSLNEAGLRLGVCWMLTPKDSRPDGKRVSYLDNGEYQKYSPNIYNTLRGIVKSGRRNVMEIQSADMFSGAKYYNSISEISLDEDIDLYFLDPDNGFEIKSVARDGAGQYVSWGIASRIFSDGNSLLVYQHFPRVNRAQYMNELTEKIKANIGAGSIGHIHTGNVDFVVIAQLEHREQISRALENLKIRAGGFLAIKEE